MRNVSIAAALLVMAGVARAQQDGLTVTDILAPGQYSVTTGIAIAEAETTLPIPGFAVVELESSTMQLFLDIGVGLGDGFELEFMIPYQFAGTDEGSATAVFPLPVGAITMELEQDKTGFGDLEINGNYRILEESADSPQFIFGAILVLPTGNDKRGQAELDIIHPLFPGIEVEGEDGAIGDGVFRYGFGTAISKRFGVLEPYLGLQYVIGGERERNDIDEDRADVLSILLGTEIHLTETSTLDLAILLQDQSEDITEQGRVEVEEEDHSGYGVQAQGYFDAGASAAIVVGFTAFWIEDHMPDITSPVDLQDSFLWQISFGVHFLFGD